MAQVQRYSKAVKRFLKIFAFFLVAAVAGAAATLVLHIVNIPKPSSGVDVSYADFLSITLTALSLMITVLGLFIAAAGVVGWTTLESKLKSHSLDYFSAQLGKDGPLRTELEQLITKIAYKGVEIDKAAKPDEAYND